MVVIFKRGSGIVHSSRLLRCSNDHSAYFLATVYCKTTWTSINKLNAIFYCLVSEKDWLLNLLKVDWIKKKFKVIKLFHYSNWAENNLSVLFITSHNDCQVKSYLSKETNTCRKRFICATWINRWQNITGIIASSR